MKTHKPSLFIIGAGLGGHWLCGRLATYQYLDMDKTIRNAMDTIREAGL